MTSACSAGTLTARFDMVLKSASSEERSVGSLEAAVRRLDLCHVAGGSRTTCSGDLLSCWAQIWLLAYANVHRSE